MGSRPATKSRLGGHSSPIDQLRQRNPSPDVWKPDLLTIKEGRVGKISSNKRVGKQNPSKKLTMELFPTRQSKPFSPKHKREM